VEQTMTGDTFTMGAHHMHAHNEAVLKSREDRPPCWSISEVDVYSAPLGVHNIAINPSACL